MAKANKPKKQKAGGALAAQNVPESESFTSTDDYKDDPVVEVKGQLVDQEPESPTPPDFNGETQDGPMHMTWPAISRTTELIQETRLYFISATVSFFKGGYQVINLWGVHRLNDVDLEEIGMTVMDLFRTRIEIIGKAQVKDWNGLPMNHILTINTINRL